MRLLRPLLRDPRTSLPALLLLAVGAGGFSWLMGLQRSLALRSLPVPSPAQLVSIRNAQADDLDAGGTPSYGELGLMREGGSVAFSGIAAYASSTANLGGEDGQPEAAKLDRVTANAFQVFGVKPALGRDFNAQDEDPGQMPSVILTDAFWHGHFGADPGAVGRPLRVDGHEAVIAGVLPPGFHTPWGTQIFMPLAVTAEQRASFGAHFLNPFGRLWPGVSPGQGAAAMAAVAERFKQAHPDFFDTPEARKYTLTTRPLLDDALGNGVKILSALKIAAILVLILASLNASAMLLARGQGRRRELAIRSALGASAARLRTGLVAEGACLGLIGAALGLVLAGSGLGAASRALQWSFPGLDLSGLHLDGVTAATALAFGPVLGALCASAAKVDADPAQTLKEGGRGQMGGHRHLRRRLVLAQLALATALLAAAAWLQGGVGALLRAPLGLEPAQVWTFSLSPSKAMKQDPARLEAVASALRARLAQLPGVRSAGVLNNTPMSGMRSDLGMLAGGVRFDPEARSASPGALETLGIRLLRGRDFTADDRADTQPVAILTRSLARAAFGDADPIGKAVSFESGENRIVVGVVEDYREFGPAQPAVQVAFLPYAQGGSLWNATMNGVLKVQGPAPSERAIRELAREAAPDLAVASYAPLSRNLEGVLGPQRMARAFMMAFAGLALLLAAGGVYGLMAASVAERKGEFGVRSALGATMRDLLALVLGESTKLAIGGAALGLLLGLALRASGGGWLGALPSTSLAAPLGAAALLVCATLSATLLPAFRAARVDPMEALRNE